MHYSLLLCSCEGNSYEHLLPKLSKFCSCHSLRLINSGLMEGLHMFTCRSKCNQIQFRVYSMDSLLLLSVAYQNMTLSSVSKNKIRSYYSTFAYTGDQFWGENFTLTTNYGRILLSTLHITFHSNIKCYLIRFSNNIKVTLGSNLLHSETLLQYFLHDLVTTSD